MKKRYKLKNFGYISSICPEAPIDGFGVAIGAADVITCTNFLVIGEGVWILWGGGRKLPSPIDKASRRNTGLALPRSP